MTYKINGVELTMQPTNGRWMQRENLGFDGNGRPIYPAVRTFELRWGLMSQTDFYQLMNQYQSLNVTGSAIVDLPNMITGSYAFRSYTGCYVNEPVPSNYFAENVSEVVLVISNIRI